MRYATIVALISSGCFCVSACGRQDPDIPPPATSAPAAVAPATTAQAPMSSAMPHGDHNPHHGGVVMMKGDLHYEVVADPAGIYHVYFTDAVRADLPAATAQSVALTIQRGGQPDESVPLHIDDAGESWEGQGRKVDDPASATVRVAFTIKGDQPYWIDLPFSTPPKPQAP